MRLSSQKLEHQSVSICVLYISGARHTRPQMTAVSHSRFLSINISVGIMNDRRLKLRKDLEPQAELPVSTFCLCWKSH